MAAPQVTVYDEFHCQLQPSFYEPDEDQRNSSARMPDGQNHIDRCFERSRGSGVFRPSQYEMT